MKTQRPETAPTPRRIVDSCSYELQSPDEPCPAWWRRWCRALPAASSSPAPSQPPSTTAPCSTPPTRCCTPRRLTSSRCVGPRLSTARNCCKPLLFCDIIRQKIIKNWLRCQWGSAPRSSALAPVGYVKTFCHCARIQSPHILCKYKVNCKLLNQIDEDNAPMESHQSLQAGAREKLICFHTIGNLKDWGAQWKVLSEILC